MQMKEFVTAVPEERPSAPSKNGNHHRELARFNGDYVRRLNARDPETEQHFAAYFGDLLSHKLHSTVYSPDLAKDIHQETLKRVLMKLRSGDLRQPESLAAYVLGICNNVMREKFREEAHFQDLGEQGFAMLDWRSNAESDVLNSELSEHVQAVLNELATRDRELLKAVFLDEEDKDEVCHRFGVDRTYLRVLVFRARKRFQSRFSGTSPTVRGGK